MAADLVKAINELSQRMRLLKAMQEEASDSERLTERDEMILDLLSKRGRMTISEIAAEDPNVSFSTISLNITKLWRKLKLVSKTISPENQRTTFVELNEKGREAIEAMKQQREKRFKVLYEALGVTDGEKELLMRILKRANAYFEKYVSMIENEGSKQS